MMRDRIHACLNGELPREELSAAELAELAAMEAVIDEAAGLLKAERAPDLSARVMERVLSLEAAPAREAGPAAALGRALAWLWRPRSLQLRLRPAYALAALLAAAALPWLAPRAPLPSPLAGGGIGAAPRVYVHFHLEARGASRVVLAGSFTDWQPRYELHETAPGAWSVVVPLQPGVHDYAFIVDGEEWRPDPHAPTVEDGFGGANSRISLLPPSGSRAL